MLHRHDEINLKGNPAKIMGPYEPTDPLDHLIYQPEKGQELAISGGKKIPEYMMVSKGVTLLAQTETFNNNIKEWRQKSTDLKTWAKFNNFFQRAHIEQLRAVTTTRKGGGDPL